MTIAKLARGLALDRISFGAGLILAPAAVGAAPGRRSYRYECGRCSRDAAGKRCNPGGFPGP